MNYRDNPERSVVGTEHTCDDVNRTGDTSQNINMDQYGSDFDKHPHEMMEKMEDM